MSTTRMGSTCSGMRLTLVRMRSGSARASARGRNMTLTGCGAEIMALRRSSTSRPNSTLIASNSKSMRACPGSMLPPVTLAPYSRHTSADSTWRAVWVRISRWRRSQSTAARTTVPAGGGRAGGNDVEHLALLPHRVQHRRRSPVPRQPPGVTRLPPAPG